METCGISLEVWIDGEGVVAEPGNKIIKPYLNVPSQFIKFEIFPMNNQVIKGTIWISAVFPGDTRSVIGKNSDICSTFRHPNSFTLRNTSKELEEFSHHS